jgi:hypothetical protein
MLFDPIARLARRTYAQLTAEVLAKDIRARIHGAGPSSSAAPAMAESARSFYTLHSGAKFVEFTATWCNMPRGKEKEIELSGDVVAVEYDAIVDSDTVRKEHVRTLRCKEGVIRVEEDELSQTLSLELHDPVWQGPTGTEEARLGWEVIRGLVVPPAVETVTSRFRTQTGLKAAELTSGSATLQVGPSPKLRKLQTELQNQIRTTLAEIQAETHWRLVFGIGCVAMILIGIGLGIAFKGGHLLTAFGASCVPAAVLIVCIMMGRNIARNPGAQAVSGTMLMWSALAVLSLLAAVVYRRLLKN